MRRLALLAALLPVAGCSVAEPEPPVAARPLSATVRGLPFGPVWDRDVFGPNGPDVYIQVVQVDAPFGSVFRTHTENNVRVESLPLQMDLRPPPFGTYSPVKIDTRVVVEIRDDDSVTEDDLMFRSDTLHFGDLDRGNARVGGTGAFSVVTTEAEFALRFRWE